MKHTFRLFSVLIIISLAAISCALPFNLAFTPPTETPTQTSTPEVLHEIYAGFTGDAEAPFAMIHQGGENLLMLQDTATSKPRGAVWTSAQGESLTIYSDPNGRPNTVIVGETVIFYSNYTSDSVDMTVLDQQGQQVTVTAPLDVENLQKIMAARARDYELISFSRPSLRGEEPLDTYFWMQTGLYMLNVATCTAGVLAAATGGSVAVGMFAGIVPGGQLALLLLAKSCAGALLSTIIRVGKIAGMDVSYWEDINQKFAAVSCVIDLGVIGNTIDKNMLVLKDSKGLASCLGVLVSAAKELDKLVRQSVNKKPQYVGLQLGTFEFEKLPTVTPSPTLTLLDLPTGPTAALQPPPISTWPPPVSPDASMRAPLLSCTWSPMTTTEPPLWPLSPVALKLPATSTRPKLPPSNTMRPCRLTKLGACTLPVFLTTFCSKALALRAVMTT